MSYFHWIAGCTLGLAWLWRLADAALGVPTIADISRPEWDRQACRQPPSQHHRSGAQRSCGHRGDAHSIARSRLHNYEVIAVDDRSTDRTGEIMEEIAAATPPGRLKVIRISDLPPGWMGKPHAMWSAGNQASGDWLLFTDADVLFKPDALRRALAYAETEPADHLVLFPRMIMKTPGEKMMIAFFQTLFVFGHRPWKVADPKTKDHIGVGAFNLVRRQVYEAVGTYAALRFEVLDDMKLGKVVKNAGFAQRNVFGADLISIRWAKGAMGVVDNLTKNFFALMSFQWPRALASCFALAFLNLMPFAGVFLAHGWPRLGYAVALFSMFSIHVGMSTKSDVPPYYFLLHPREHVAVPLHPAAVDVSDLVARRHSLAWDVLSVAGAEERNGVADLL